jgi:DNA-binding NarL/FixJ family response regulator
MYVLNGTEEKYRGWTGVANGQSSGLADGCRSGIGAAEEPGAEVFLHEGMVDPHEDPDDPGVGGVVSQASGDLQTVIYLDPRTLTRDCVGGWLQTSLIGYLVRPLSDPERLKAAPLAGGPVRAVIINTGGERVSSDATADLVSRVKEILPGVPVAILSDYEDRESVRAAFNLGVRGYIPTSLASLVAVGAMSLVCVGGTFAPTSALLLEADAPGSSAAEPLIEGFTRRQTQILDRLRCGMANKVIAFELDMCESTVKVHIRNIMKKLNATNRTQVVYLTRGLFESNNSHQDA